MNKIYMNEYQYIYIYIYIDIYIRRLRTKDSPNEYSVKPLSIFGFQFFFCIHLQQNQLKKELNKCRLHWSFNVGCWGVLAAQAKELNILHIDSHLITPLYSNPNPRGFLPNLRKRRRQQTINKQENKQTNNAW